MKLYTPSRVARGLNERFFFKAYRDNSPKSSSARRPYPPGMHGKRARRGGGSEFGLALQEKQKVRYLYGISDQVLKRYVRDASMAKGRTKTEALMQSLEERLDSVVYRMGFALSRRIARQLVSHGHITVDGRRVRSASYRLRPGQKVSIREGSKIGPLFASAVVHLKKYEPPEWIVMDPEAARGELKRRPLMEDRLISHNLDKIIEFYSR